jgi:hypothetical protein
MPMPRRRIETTLVADRQPSRRVDTLVRVHRRILAVSCGVLALLLGACGGSGSKSSSPAVTTPPGANAGTGNGTTNGTGHVAKAADPNAPSISAKMICQTATVNDIAAVIGIKTVSISTPVWKDQVFSCDYVYPKNAKMKLSVKELSSVPETDTYYQKLATDLGKKQDLQGLGQGAFSTKSGSVVTRKDYKVLTVDTSGLPAQFGVPPDTRENDAINVSFTIMECWVGA